MSEWLVRPDGTRLRIREETGWGRPVATVVLAHCYALDMDAWGPLCSLLLDRPVRLLRLDQRGHGASDAAAPGTGLADLGDDLAALVTERVPDGPVVLVGHSMGGMAVMAMADRHPDLVADRVAGVALLATSSAGMGTMTLGLPAPVARVALGIERIGMSVLAAAGGGGAFPCPPALLGPLTRWLGFGPDPRPSDVAAVSALAARCRLGGIAGLRRTIDAHDCRLALMTFDGIPAVVAVGTEDRVTPVRHAAEIAQLLPHARLSVFPGAGHMLPVERADEVAALVGGLIDDAVAGWDGRVGVGYRLPAAA